MCATRAEDALSALAAEAAGGRPGRRCGAAGARRPALAAALRQGARPSCATGDLAAASLTLWRRGGRCTEAGFVPEQLANLSRLALAEALQGHLHRARELVDAATRWPGSSAAEAAAPLPAALVAAESWTLVERGRRRGGADGAADADDAGGAGGAGRHRRPAGRAVVTRGPGPQDATTPRWRR